MKLTRVLAVILLVVLLASSVSAFNGLRKGFVLGGGLGMSPYATWSLDETWFGIPLKYSEDNVGVAVNLVIGYAWDEFNMIVYEGNIVVTNSDLIGDQVGQGFNGASWYHYFGPAGKSFFTVVGGGAYVFDPGDYDANDIGLGYLVGAGFEFTPHVQVAAYLSGGQTSDVGVTFGHNHISLMVSAVAF